MDMMKNITNGMNIINDGIKNINDDIKNSKFLSSLQDGITNIINEAKIFSILEKEKEKVSEEKVSEEKVSEERKEIPVSKGLSVINTPDDLIVQDSEIQTKYLGCFNDGQGQPLFGYRFPQKVNNVNECIELGKNSKYNYIALKNGDECWAGNSKYNAYGEVEKKLCNIRCKNPSTQTCGGSVFNQVYKTNFYEPERIESKILNQMNPVIIDIDFRDENIDSDSNTLTKNEYTSNIEDKIFAITKETFSNVNDMKDKNYKLLRLEKFEVDEDDYKKIEKIDKNIDYKDFKCVEPLNMNYLFLYIVIVVVLVTMICIYLRKK